MTIYLLLFYEFFKIGLLAIGGGYAAIPFLYHISEKYSWYTTQELADMIAVANITPGPIGINMATYAGYKTAGLLGSIISTTAIVLPSLIIVLSIVKVMKKLKEAQCINDIFAGLKPAACAMICAIGLKLFYENVFAIGLEKQIYLNWPELILFSILIILLLKTKIHPSAIIGISAIAGILVHHIIF